MEGNEKFQERKCAYFLTKVKGKGSKKNVLIFFHIPPKGLGRETGVQKIPILIFNKFLEYVFTLF